MDCSIQTFQQIHSSRYGRLKPKLHTPTLSADSKSLKFPGKIQAKIGLKSVTCSQIFQNRRSHCIEAIFCLSLLGANRPTKLTCVNLASVPESRFGQKYLRLVFEICILYFRSVWQSEISKQSETMLTFECCVVKYAFLRSLNALTRNSFYVESIPKILK